MTEPSQDIGRPTHALHSLWAGHLGRSRTCVSTLILARQPTKPPNPPLDSSPASRSCDPSCARPSPSTTAPSSLCITASNNLGIQTFFCEPSPWQKGGIENAIGRIVASCRAKLIPRNPSRDPPAFLPPTITPRENALTSKPRRRFFSHLLHFKCESPSRFRGNDGVGSEARRML